MKAEAMRAKSADELKEMIMDLRKEQMTLRFQKSGQQLQNTAQIRVVRRDIARAKTLLKAQSKATGKATKPTAPKTAPAKKAAKAPAAGTAAKATAKKS